MIDLTTNGLIEGHLNIYLLSANDLYALGTVQGHLSIALVSPTPLSATGNILGYMEAQVIDIALIVLSGTGEILGFLETNMDDDDDPGVILPILPLGNIYGFLGLVVHEGSQRNLQTTGQIQGFMRVILPADPATFVDVFTYLPIYLVGTVEADSFDGSVVWGPECIIMAEAYTAVEAPKIDYNFPSVSIRAEAYLTATPSFGGTALICFYPVIEITGEIEGRKCK